jgi:hypothetical protein
VRYTTETIEIVVTVRSTTSRKPNSPAESFTITVLELYSRCVFQAPYARLLAPFSK